MLDDFDMTFLLTLSDKWIPLPKKIKKSRTMPPPCGVSCLYFLSGLFSFICGSNNLCL